MLGKRRSKSRSLTGPDYLIGAADGAAADGQPFAEEFRDLVWTTFSSSSEGPLRLAEMTAQRPLKAHETSPVAIILRAAAMARQDNDDKALDEVLQVGMSLLAKWPSFLLSRVDGHPDFDWKG